MAECSERSEERTEATEIEAVSQVAECPDDAGIGMYRSAVIIAESKVAE